MYALEKMNLCEGVPGDRAGDQGAAAHAQLAQGPEDEARGRGTVSQDFSAVKCRLFLQKRPSFSCVGYLLFSLIQFELEKLVGTYLCVFVV